MAGKCDTQQAHDVKTTSYQRRCDVMTLGYIDGYTTFLGCLPAGFYELIDRFPTIILYVLLESSAIQT